jgi:hypothetical protein
MNLLWFAVASMTQASPEAAGGGGQGNTPPNSASITIEFDNDTGKPVAKPDSAWVQPGGEIVWTCDKRFEIICKMMWTGERVTRKSNKGEKGLEVLTTTASANNGRYSYGIKVEGFEEVDPDVVIGPRSR